MASRLRESKGLEVATWVGCLYGDQDRRDRVLFEFHAFSLVVTLSLCFLLFGNSKLRRIYAPLSNIVNAALALQVVSDFLFFADYPYSDTKGNCPEIISSRLYILLVMFGEMHQCYFIANVLGMTRFRFHIPCYGPLSLEYALRIATLLAGASIFLALFNKPMFMMIHDIWALLVVTLQLYFISTARKGSGDHSSTALVDVKSDAVSIFEALSWLQIIPTTIALADRVLEYQGVFLFVSLDGVMLILECLTIYLFYIKILVLQEKANTVSVEVVET